MSGVCTPDTIPSDVNYLGNLNASAGVWGYASGIITWIGNVSTSVPVTITFNAAVRAGITMPSHQQQRAHQR